jgi:hypothetical protein
MTYAPTTYPLVRDPRIIPDAAPAGTVSSAPADAGGSGAVSLEDALILRRITDSAWQICDSRRPPHTPGYLLGFVERMHSGVELMQLGNRFIWTAFPDMRAALDHVAATAAETAEKRAAGDLSWVG